MRYAQMVPGVFLSRPNRFIAHCLIDGRQTVCHVKNTGRCKELLLPGNRVFLQHLPSPGRKTEYDLIAVESNGILFNIDSQAPNKAAAEWLPTFLGKDTVVRPEYAFGHSRLDFYAEAGRRRIFMEVKGVTLLRDRRALFPDAPTKRGVKHLQELTEAAGSGYECYVLFVIQTEDATAFSPNRTTDPAFADALQTAFRNGVHLLAYTCRVTPDTMILHRQVPVIF